jgi:diguanylate cyclase (GGDEF)-like protein
MNSSTKLNFILTSVAVVTITLSSFCGWVLYQAEERSITREFSKDVDERAASIYREMLINFEPLRSLAILFNGDAIPEYTRFQNEAQGILSRHSDIQALEWIPRITHSERPQFVSRIRQYFPDYEIKEQNEQGQIVIAGTRQAYFPIYYVEPLETNEVALGFDISSSASRLEKLEQSRDGGMPLATASTMIVQDNGKSKWFFAFLPIYRGDSSTVEQRRKNLLGFILGIYRSEDIFTSSALSNRELGIDMTLEDITLSSESQILYIHKSRTGFPVYEDLVYHKELPDIWGRKWALIASPTVNYINSRRGMLPLIMFGIGIAFTVFIVWYIRMNERRTATIQKIVTEKTNELSEANRKLELLSRADALTGIANRRTMDEVLNQEWLRAIRNQSSLSFILIDIDYFKYYNDNYGHVMGDKCLKKVAVTLQAIPRRAADLVARYGGEEFALVLAETENAKSVAEECRRAIEALQIPHLFSDNANILTISVGLCTCIPESGTSPNLIIDSADKALYNAKRSGRNRVISLC